MARRRLADDRLHPDDFIERQHNHILSRSFTILFILSTSIHMTEPAPKIRDGQEI